MSPAVSLTIPSSQNPATLPASSVKFTVASVVDMPKASGLPVILDKQKTTISSEYIRSVFMWRIVVVSNYL